METSTNSTATGTEPAVKGNSRIKKYGDLRAQDWG